MQLYFTVNDGDVIATKRAINGDIRTRELEHLAQKKSFPLYLDTEDIARFQEQARQRGFILKGKRDDISFDTITHILNGMDGNIEDRILRQYSLSKKPYLLQGGAEYSILQKDFLSAPNTRTSIFPEKYVGTSARQVSCNTTYAGTVLGLVLNTIPLEDIARVEILLKRRSRDSGETDKPLLYEDTPQQSHHANDVENILPQLEGKIYSVAQKMPWEHYHHAELTITLKKSITNFELELVRDAFRLYDRCVYVSHKPPSNSLNDLRRWIQTLREISTRLGLPDGDTLLLTAHVEKNAPNSLSISGETPQRSIVALSTIDWLGIVKGQLPETVMMQTNKIARWHGYSLSDLKQTLERTIYSTLNRYG